MKRILLISILFISVLSSCKKEQPKKYPLPLKITITNQSSSTLISMEIDDQNGKRVFTMTDRGPIDMDYGTQDVNSGDVLKIHYSTKNTNGSADFKFTWNGTVVGVSGGLIGGTTGKTLTVNIP